MHNELIKQFSKYNKKELYQWLIVSMIHPSNQKFGIRFELLIYTLLSMNEEQFLNKPLKRKNFESLISWFEKKYSTDFVMMEDFTPFDQRKLIPIFLDGQKYYYFYGPSERPYEFIKQFHEILFDLDNEKTNEIKAEFILSLERQTKILTHLVKNRESCNQSSNIYIPTFKFFKWFKSFFTLESANDNFLHSPNGFYQMGINNFNGTYTKIGSEYFIVPFECHTEVFYGMSECLIYDGDCSLFPALNEQMQIRLRKIIFQFFGYRQILLCLMDIFKENMTGYFDVVVRIDADKILLFKFVPYSEQNKLYDNVESIADEALKQINEIKEKNKWIGIRYLGEETDKVSVVPIEVLEFTTVLIFEQLSLGYMFGLDNNWQEDNIFIFNALDIKPIYELLREKKSDIDISFLQYLNAEKNLSKTKMVKTDELDSFAYYYSNYESFHISGHQPDMMTFASHGWSDLYNKYLYAKYQDNIYELVERQYPNKFNVIQHTTYNTYEVIDTAILDGGRCIKYGNNLIWITYPNGLGMIKNEVRTVMFLGQFISYYIDRYKDKLFSLLNQYGFDAKKQQFMIALYPDTFVQSFKELSHFLPFIKALSKTKNIIFTSYARKHYDEIFTAMLFTSKFDSLQSTFEFKDSFNPEREVFKEFLISLLTSLNVENPVKIAQDFINENWNLDQRAFVFKAFYTDNPKFEVYKAPHKFQDSFIANVNQEIVTYLKDLNIEPKEYWEDDAKQLNNLIFEFLQKRLEEELAKFNKSVLHYTYTQIEYIEGKREKDKYQINLDVHTYNEYDTHDRFNKQRMEVSELTVAAKHILHSILKVDPKGAKAIVDKDWYYFMALSKIINITIQLSDQLHYGLIESGIKITDSYEFEEIHKSSAIDMDQYHKKITSSKIESAKMKPLIDKEPQANKEPKKTQIFDSGLNTTWKDEFGFYLDDMIAILTNLGMYDYQDKVNFPLLSLSMSEIQERIKETLVEPPSDEEIEKIIDFTSIGFDTYESYNYLNYSIDRLMKKKERINLSPLIKIGDKYLYGHQSILNASQAWFYPLIEGDIPFSIDDKSQIKKELDRIHEVLDRELEKNAYKIAAKTIGEEYVRKNIDKFKTLSETFPQKPACGEIDLLVVNPRSKIVFVMDAKNVNKKFFVSAIDRELNKFLKGEKSYLKKLNLKAEFIKDNLEEILTHFKIKEKNNWNVQKGFVVNTLYTSAFYKEKVDFVLIDDLSEYLLQNQVDNK